MVNNDEEPELISTSSGSSVFYKNKYLYSRYSPKRQVLRLVDQVTIPADTLVICVSPVLGYGLRELLHKVPLSSFVIAVECSENLMNISLKHIDKDVIENSRFFYVRTNSIQLFLTELQKKIKVKNFKHVLRLDFSAGANLFEKFYFDIENCTKEYIARYWINRLTLIQFGRIYASNFFKNYCEVVKSKKQFAILQPNSIGKPIVVVGAGPSLDNSFNFIKENRNAFFVLAVDATLSSLLPHIKPDAVVVLESQYWIQKAFIGTATFDIPIIADLTSSSGVLKNTLGPIVLFFTEYIEHSFFEMLNKKNVLPTIFEPMGSVGLSALKIAIFLAKSGIPIFHTGLDFAWGMAFTHSKMSYQVRDMFSSCTKLNGLYRPENIFPAKTIVADGKNGSKVFTSPSLSGYAELYKRIFSHQNPENPIFDIGSGGIELNSVLLDGFTAKKLLQKTVYCEESEFSCFKKAELFYSLINDEKLKLIEDFLQCEKEKLVNLKNVFTNKIQISDDSLKDLIHSMPYLYLHFADYSTENIFAQNFLNRLRIELEHFLKIIGNSD